MKIPESEQKNNFTPHPKGSFMAVCCDVFTKTTDNKWFGVKNKWGNVDNRQQITKVCISFLTTEMIEIDGEDKPRYASFWGNYTLGSEEHPSNIRKFLQSWKPDEDPTDLDVELLIGQGAYLTIVHNESNGETYANVVSAVTPPEGSKVPEIPSDFVRHKDKPKDELPSALPTVETSDTPF